MKKKQIRMGVFETNSSSTHSLVVGTKEQFEKWESGELFYYEPWRGDKKFVTNEEVEELKKGEKFYEDCLHTYDSWNTDYEEDTYEYTTPNEEHIVIRAYYGYDE